MHMMGQQNIRKDKNVNNINVSYSAEVNNNVLHMIMELVVKNYKLF